MRAQRKPAPSFDAVYLLVVRANEGVKKHRARGGRELAGAPQRRWVLRSGLYGYIYCPRGEAAGVATAAATGRTLSVKAMTAQPVNKPILYERGKSLYRGPLPPHCKKDPRGDGGVPRRAADYSFLRFLNVTTLFWNCEERNRWVLWSRLHRR